MITVLVDGVLVDPVAPSIPVMDRGFLYGDSVFEVTRTYDGQPFAVRAHLDRLRLSCARLGISLEVDDATLRAEMDLGLRSAGHEESYMRLMVTRGVTPIGLHLGHDVASRRVVVVLPLSPQPAAIYEDGVELATVTSARALDGSCAAGAKASNYLPNILSLAAAQARGGYEALSVGPSGEILEGATSNVFLVKNGVVRTPPLSMGVLGGITRQLVMQGAGDDGIEVREELLFPSDLYGADEACITSSLREVVPVVRADGVALGDGRPGAVVRRLHAAFQRRAQATLEAERG